MVIKAAKKKTNKKLKEECWKLYSRWIRTKYSKDGFVQCYTCGVVKPIKEMQAGHGISGRGNYVLFLDDVVRPQCPHCNLNQPYGLGGNYPIFIPKLIQEIGLAAYNEHVQLSGFVHKFPKGFLEDKIAELKSLLKEA